jgi:hypothetical protein
MAAAKKLIVVLLFGSVALMGGQPAGSALVNEGYSGDIDFLVLKGVEQVRVSVRQVYSVFMDRSGRRNPLDMSELQRQAEDTLFDLGIAVVGNTEERPDVPELVITVNTWPTRLLSQPIMEVRTELYQTVEVVGSHRPLKCATWPGSNSAGKARLTQTVNMRDMKRLVEAEVRRQMKVFSFSHEAANGRRHRLITGTGTIRYLRFEGGFYGLISDDGTKYNVNVPYEYRNDGVRVWFRLRKRRHQISNRMWGINAEIIEMRALARYGR